MTIECFEFYNLCQAYRHAPTWDQEKTCAAYKQLIEYIDAAHLQEMKTLAEASEALLLAYANTAIRPEHKPAWKALIEALKTVRPFLEEK